MPLGARDIFVVIHAKDEASRVIAGVGRSFGTMDAAAQQTAGRMMAMGGALLGLGTAMAGLGAAGVAVLLDFTKQAMEYRRQANLTLTQVDQLGVSVQQIEQIGKSVASNIAAPFVEMQPALFDIFSSMDVNVPEAEKMLRETSKAAVAGQVDVQTAARATMAIMNAYGIPVEEVSKVLDVQFQLVRKGVGTYEEFATAIGRAIPSARRSGQTVETLAGAMAFLTRNGLSADMAATSAARAFDSLAHPKVIERMAKMGVQVLDANGNMRQMNDVVTELAGKFEGLTDAEKNKRLNELFQGAGGTIQARRFWDMAIRNFDELNQRTNEMINSSGALENAYKIMLEDPAMAMQLFKNNWDILKTEIGSALIPVLLALVGWLTKVFQWFNNLSPEVKQWVAWIAAAGSAALILVGAITGIAGALLILRGAAQMLGMSLMRATGIFGLIAVALGAIAWAVIDNWDKIKPWLDENIPGWTEKFKGFVDWLKATWEELWPVVKETVLKALQAILEKAEEVWPKVEEAIKDAYNWIKNTFIPFMTDTVWPIIREIWDWLYENSPKAWNAVVDAVKAAYNWIKDSFIPWIRDDLWGTMKQVWSWIEENVPKAWDQVVQWTQTAWDKLKEFWAWIQAEFGPGWERIWKAIEEDVIPILTNIAVFVGAVLVIMYNLFIWFKNKLAEIWDFLWPWTEKYVIETWNNIAQHIDGALQLIKGITEVFAGLFTLDWDKFWQGVKDIAGGIWTMIGAAFKQWLFTTLMGPAMLFKMVLFWAWSQLWDEIKGRAALAWQAIQTAWDGFLNFLRVQWNNFTGPFRAAWDLLWSQLAAPVMGMVMVVGGLIGVLISIFNSVKDAIQQIITIAGRVRDAIVGGFNFTFGVGGILGPLGSIIGALDSIISKAGAVKRAIENIPKNVGGIVSTAGRIAANPIGAAWDALPWGASGGPLWPGRTMGINEAGPEIINMNTGGSFSRVIPNTLAFNTVSRYGNSVQSQGGGVTLLVQGPIADREDLVYKADDRMSWHEFTRGQ